MTMKNLDVFVIIIILFLCSCSELSVPTGENISPSMKPNQSQIEQIQRGYGMFICLGVNTFNDVEWSYGKLPASSYNPTELDCDQWIRFAKDAGFRYVLLVTKHHDGFCLWDSKYTDYDVGSSPVKTNVVKQVMKACKKYGVDFAAYYSLWDMHEPSHNDPDPQKYVNYMNNQLTEIFSFGDVCEVWFDGGWGKKKEEDWKLDEVYAHIKKMNPKCVVTVNHTVGRPEDVHKERKPGEYQKGDPIRFFPVDFRIKDPDLVRWDDPKHYIWKDELYYLPFEHTICLSAYWNWYQKKDMRPCRSVDELEEMFYWCTANDNLLILNVPPDQRGLIREHERLRVLELADRLGIRGGEKPLPTGPVNLTFNQKATATSTWENDKQYDASRAVDFDLQTRWASQENEASLEIGFERREVFDRISLFEYGDVKTLSEYDYFSKVFKYRIKKFNIEAFDGKQWRFIHVGGQIGPCRIVRLPEKMTAIALRINVIKSDGPPSLYHIGVSGSWTRRVRKLGE